MHSIQCDKYNSLEKDSFAAVFETFETYDERENESILIIEH